MMKEKTMEEKVYREKVLGGWLGKAVGGTLGQPYEGSDGPLNLTFYDPVPTDMIPNDDLDLQVLWACLLDASDDPVVDRNRMARAWVENIGFPCDEYGIAIRNLKRGIPAPWSGRFDNYFTDGLGAAIRSELWAFLAPGDPERAAQLAFEDGCVDHDGDGLYAEQFLAALESMAFVESNIPKLLESGLSVIPRECRLARSIRDTMEWVAEGLSFTALRQRILTHYGSDNFTDVKMNFGFITAALLLGRGDFSRSICTAVNFGRDADCTGATVGAILGILDPSGIGEEWLRPIGRTLMVSPGLTGFTPPPTIDAFADLVASLRSRIRLSETPEAPRPDFTPFEIRFDTALNRPWFAQDDQKCLSWLKFEYDGTLTVPGYWFKLDPERIPTDSLLLLRTGFRIEAVEPLRLMVNTNANLRVWVDGEYRFGREGGRMSPSFHRAPLNQYCDLDLPAGEHELVIGLAPLDRDREIEVIFGLGTRRDLQWLPDAFRQQ